MKVLDARYQMKIKALDKSNCAAARLGGKEAGVKATSLRTETGYEAGGVDKLAPQSEVQVSTPKVKPGLCCESHIPYPGRPARRAVHRMGDHTVPSPATVVGSPQESAEVVVARDTSWE